jgi:hypothetical protein
MYMSLLAHCQYSLESIPAPNIETRTVDLRSSAAAQDLAFDFLPRQTFQRREVESAESSRVKLL